MSVSEYVCMFCGGRVGRFKDKGQVEQKSANIGVDYVSALDSPPTNNWKWTVFVQ